MPDPLREWAREYREKLCSGDPTKTLLHFRADDFELELEKMGESLARRCAEIARHFANDELTREEWPPHGLVKREGRFDNGIVGKTADNIERAILREWGVKEEKIVMSWSIGFDMKWQRDIGYGVPAICDHPDCDKRIDRGLSYVCGGEPYGGDEGCGLYFCYEHLRHLSDGNRRLCDACASGDDAFAPKPDHPDWIRHKLTDVTWQEWRNDNPIWVERHSGEDSSHGK